MNDAASAVVTKPSHLHDKFVKNYKCQLHEQVKKIQYSVICPSISNLFFLFGAAKQITAHPKNFVQIWFTESCFKVYGNISLRVTF